MRCTYWLVFLSGLLTSLTRLVAGNDGLPEFQNKDPTKLVWAAEGDNVDLPCDLTPPIPSGKVSMVLWIQDHKNEGIPLYNLDARSRPGDFHKAVHHAISNDLGKRSYFQVGDGHRAKLRITNVTFNDQGIFRCRVDFVDSPTRNFRVNLTLVEPPTKPVIYDAQGRQVTGVGGPFLEGYDLTLICQVSGGKPKPLVSWWKDGKLLDDVIDKPAIGGASSKFTMNHLFISNVSRALWGAKLECKAQSGSMGKPLVQEVPLDIYLKPAVIKIILTEDQIQAGRPVTVRCETWGSSPAARIVWRLDGLVIRNPSPITTQRSNSTVSKIAFVLNKDDDGKELTCRAENPRFPGGVLEETQILHVAYAPVAVAHLANGYILDTLREGDDLKLVCDVQSNPPPSSIKWYHNNVKLKHDVTAGVLISANTLALRSLNLSHSGEYTCLVSNDIGETRSLPVHIRMKYVPRCRKGHERKDIAVLRHDSLLLRCEVDSVPNDGVRFSWTYNSTQGEVLPMQNSRVQNKGLVSTLEYKASTDEDFGTFACWATNSVGRQRSPCIFNVVPARAPQPPIDCSLHNESNLVEVSCSPGSDGGLPQHFLLEVRGTLQNSMLYQPPQTLQTPQSDQGSVGEVSPIYRESNPDPIFLLHDLEPGFDYTVTVYAVNGQGKSKPVQMDNVRVVEPIGEKSSRSDIFLQDLKSVLPKTDSEHMIIILALVGLGAMVFIGIGVAIGLTICRRGTTVPMHDGPDDFTTPTYVPALRVEPRSRFGTDRRRSQRTSHYIEESRNEPDLLQQVEIELQG